MIKSSLPFLVSIVIDKFILTITIRNLTFKESIHHLPLVCDSFDEDVARLMEKYPIDISRKCLIWGKAW